MLGRDGETAGLCEPGSALKPIVCAGPSPPAQAIKIEIGPLKGDYRVFGNRFWRYNESGNVSVAGPQPFTRMPPAPDRSFGGPQDATCTRWPI